MADPTDERVDKNGESTAEGRQSTDGGSEPAEDVQPAAPSGEPSFDRNVLELDHVFEVLDQARRRYLLYALATDREWTLAELATKLAAWENDVHEEAVDDRTRDRVYVSLYHAHVPKLVEEAVVRFDEEAETISPGPHADQVLAVLEGAGASLDSRQEKHAEREYEDDASKHEDDSG